MHANEPTDLPLKDILEFSPLFSFWLTLISAFLILNGFCTYLDLKLHKCFDIFLHFYTHNHLMINDDWMDGQTKSYIYVHMSERLVIVKLGKLRGKVTDKRET